VIWPVWTHWPVRRAIGQVLKELAAYLDALGACVLAGTPAGDPRWMQLGRLHPRRIRDALEAARAIALAIHTRRAGESRTGGNLRVLLGLLESQFLLMVTLASELESLPPGARAVAPDWFAHGAAACEAIRAQLLSRAWRRHARPAAPTPLPAAKDNLAHLLAALEEESARSLLLVSSLDQAVPLQAAEPSAALQVSVRLELRLLADALSIRSPIFRHALRVAIAAAAASLLGAAVSPHHAAWVTVTALVVLQPFSGATVRRAVERTAGTVLGGMVALALTALTARPFALALIMFPLSVAAVVTRRRSYPLFTFFLTPIFVLIATRDSGDWWVAAIRSGDTVLGGAIALATSLLVFRGVDERTGLSNALERMVRAATAYSESALASLAAGEVAQGQLPERRRAAALAISDAEAALERRLAEPLRRGENDERAVELVTYTRRLTMASTTLVTMDARGLLEERSRQELVGRVEQFAQLVRSAAGQLAPGAA